VLLHQYQVVVEGLLLRQSKYTQERRRRMAGLAYDRQPETSVQGTEQPVFRNAMSRRHNSAKKGFCLLEHRSMTDYARLKTTSISAVAGCIEPMCPRGRARQRRNHSTGGRTPELRTVQCSHGVDEGDSAAQQRPSIKIRSRRPTWSYLCAVLASRLRLACERELMPGSKHMWGLMR